MNPRDIQRLLTESLTMAEARQPDWPTRFYARLFEAAPQARGMFPDDMSILSHKFFHTIHLAAEYADELYQLDASLQAMGKRHAARGVSDGDYEVVTRCLLDTLAEAMADASTQLHIDAWAFVLHEVSSRMIAGAHKG